MPTSTAWPRRRCTAAKTASGSVAKAWPSSVVQPISWHIISSVAGNCSKATVGGVKPTLVAACSKAPPFKVSFCNNQLPASNTSCGLAAATNTWVRIGSGYNAIGANNSSNASAVQLVGIELAAGIAGACAATGALASGVVLAAGAVLAAGVAGASSFFPQPANTTTKPNAMAV